MLTIIGPSAKVQNNIQKEEHFTLEGKYNITLHMVLFFIFSVSKSIGCYLFLHKISRPLKKKFQLLFLLCLQKIDKFIWAKKRTIEKKGQLPSGEEQAAADSRTKNATLTKKNGKAIASTSTTGSIVRLEIRRLAVAVASDPLPAPPEPDIVTRFIPDVDM